MVLRETTFVVGGALTVALGVALAVGLAWSGAGLFYFEAWLGAGITVGLGAFFVQVGRAEAKDRRENLRKLEESGTGSTIPRPP
jgi:hypothetical protein